MGRTRRYRGAGDLARGVLQRPRGHRRQPLRRGERHRLRQDHRRLQPGRPPAGTRSSANLLPSDADGQRDQFVRRLAAHDDGMDLLGMDVTWTAEFAEAGWIRELTGDAEGRGDQGHPAAADRHGHLEGQALRHPAHHQRPAALVPQVSGAQPAEDVGRDDRDGPAAQGRGQALRDRHHRGPVRGLRRRTSTTWSPRTAARSSTRTAPRPPIDDKTVQALDTAATSSPRPASPARRCPTPGARGVRATCRTARSAFSLNWPYVLSAMREANPEMVSRPRLRPVPVGRAGEHAAGDARRDELRDQHLQQAPGARRSRRRCACATRSTSSSGALDAR